MDILVEPPLQNQQLTRSNLFHQIGYISLRLMEKLGMTRRADLDFVDPAYSAADNPTIQYALSRQDWAPSSGDVVQ